MGTEKRFGDTAAGKTPPQFDEKLPSLSAYVGKEVRIAAARLKDRTDDNGQYYIVKLRVRGGQDHEVATSGRIVSGQLRDLLAAHDLPVIAWVCQAANRTLYLANEAQPSRERLESD